MADRPIIFSGPMVQALLAGRKSQTRRVLKPQPTGPVVYHQTLMSGMCVGLEREPPYAPGDRLYVREAWRVGAWRAEHWARGDGECDAEIAIDYLADEFARREWLRGDDPQMMLRLMNQSREDASQDSEINPDAAGIFHWEPGASPCRIRPLIHMPRWASRITLTVTEVRVQRLQEISAADSIAEGVECDTCTAMGQSACRGRGCFASIEAYRHLWNSLHGPDAWGANPWVVAVSFTVDRRNIDAIPRQD